MKHHLIATVAVLASGITIVSPAWAQCESCASTDMLVGTMQTQIDSSTNERMIEDTRRHDREVYLRGNRSGGNSSGAIPGYIQSRVESTSFAVLNSEFNRRVTAYGRGSAQHWLNGAARSVGSEMGRLGPEYQRRVRSEGRTQADNWYVGQARAVSQRHVANSGR